MGSVQDRVIDLQYDGFAVEPVLVIEDFPDQVDLFPVLDLVHRPTLAGIRRHVHPGARVWRQERHKAYHLFAITVTENAALFSNLVFS